MVWIVLSVIIISAVIAVGIKSGIDWSKDRGNGFGRSHMEELGVEYDKKEYDK